MTVVLLTFLIPRDDIQPVSYTHLLASPREILEHPKTEFVRRLVQRKDDFLQ